MKQRRVHVELPFATPAYSLSLALSLATLCLHRHDGAHNLGHPLFDSIRRLLRLDHTSDARRRCLSDARLVNRGGALRAEAADLFVRGEYGVFLPVAEQAMATWDSWPGTAHALFAHSAPGRLVSCALRRLLGAGWPAGWLAGAAQRSRNGMLLLARLRALLAVGDLEGAKLTAVALAEREAAAGGHGGEVRECVPLIDVAWMAQDVLGAGSLDAALGEAEHEEQVGPAPFRFTRG